MYLKPKLIPKHVSGAQVNTLANVGRKVWRALGLTTKANMNRSANEIKAVENGVKGVASNSRSKAIAEDIAKAEKKAKDARLKAELDARNAGKKITDPTVKQSAQKAYDKTLKASRQEAAFNNARRLRNKRYAQILGVGTLGLGGARMLSGSPEQALEPEYLADNVYDYDGNGTFDLYDGQNWYGDYSLLSDGSVIDRTTGNVIILGSDDGNYFDNNMRQYGLSSLDQVKLMQRLLMSLGLLGDNEDDGYFGRKTKAAVDYYNNIANSIQKNTPGGFLVTQ